MRTRVDELGMRSKISICLAILLLLIFNTAAQSEIVLQAKADLCLLSGDQAHRDSASTGMVILSSIEGQAKLYNSTDWDCLVLNMLASNREAKATRLTIDTESQKYSEYAASIKTDGEHSWAAIWTAKAIGPPHTEVEKLAFSVSPDDGKSWSAPRLLFPDSSPNFDNSRPIIRSYGAHCWAIVWNCSTMQANNGAQNQSIMLTCSDDNGHTWTEPRSIFTAFTRGARIEKSSPAFALDTQGNWLVVWPSRGDSELDVASLDFDLYFSRSKDEGKSWSLPRRIEQSAVNENDCDFDPVAETAGNGRYIVGWTRYRGVDSPHVSKRCQLFAAISNDSGASWIKVIRIDQRPPTEEAYMRHLTLATDSFANWYFAWTLFDDIWTASSLNHGDSWSKPRMAVSEQSTLRDDSNSYPFIMIDSERVPHLCWIQEFEKLPAPDGHPARVRVRHLQKATESHRK